MMTLHRRNECLRAILSICALILVVGCARLWEPYPRFSSREIAIEDIPEALRCVHNDLFPQMAVISVRETTFKGQVNGYLVTIQSRPEAGQTVVVYRMHRGRVLDICIETNQRVERVGPDVMSDDNPNEKSSP